MRKLVSTFLLFIIVGTTYAQIITPHINKKKNEKSTRFIPEKIVIIGLTDNIETRITFEKEMKERLSTFQIDAYQSIKVAPINFTKVEKAEEELNELIEVISKKGFDSFMITAVTGVEEKREDEEGYFGVYKIYHLETDIYTISKKDISLFWGMCLDMYDYQLEELPIEDYVSAIIFQMEHEHLLPENNKIERFSITN